MRWGRPGWRCLLLCRVNDLPGRSSPGDGTHILPLACTAPIPNLGTSHSIARAQSGWIQPVVRGPECGVVAREWPAGIICGNGAHHCCIGNGSFFILPLHPYTSVASHSLHRHTAKHLARRSAPCMPLSTTVCHRPAQTSYHEPCLNCAYR